MTWVLIKYQKKTKAKNNIFQIHGDYYFKQKEYHFEYENIQYSIYKSN
jgi:hypothetical protein